MKNYIIDQFVLIPISSKESALQNSTGLTLLKFKKIIDFCTNMDKKNQLLVTQKELARYFQSEENTLLIFY